MYGRNCLHRCSGTCTAPIQTGMVQYSEQERNAPRNRAPTNSAMPCQNRVYLEMFMDHQQISFSIICRSMTTQMHPNTFTMIQTTQNSSPGVATNASGRVLAIPAVCSLLLSKSSHFELFNVSDGVTSTRRTQGCTFGPDGRDGCHPARNRKWLSP